MRSLSKSDNQGAICIATVLAALLSIPVSASAQEMNAVITVKNISVTKNTTIDAGIPVLPGDNVEFGIVADADLSLFASVGNQKMRILDKQTVEIFEGGDLNLSAVKIEEQQPAGSAAATVSITVSRTYRISADAHNKDAAWGKGLVVINEGDDLKVSTTGKISYSEGGAAIGPNGTSTKAPGCLVPGLDAQSVIGRIGKGEPFKVGEEISAKDVGQHGFLHLSVNDDIQTEGAFKDNSGDLYYVVEVDRQENATAGGTGSAPSPAAPAQTPAVSASVQPPRAFIDAPVTNVLYLGVENPLELELSGVPHNEIRISASGPIDTLKDLGEGKYSITPSQPGVAKIRVDYKGQRIHEKPFSIMKLPDPVASLRGPLGPRGGDVNNGEFKAQGGLGAWLDSDFPFKVIPEVIGFELTRLTKGGVASTSANKGARYTDETKKLISEARPGDYYLFYNVKVKMPGDLSSRSINSLVFKIK